MIKTKIYIIFFNLLIISFAQAKNFSFICKKEEDLKTKIYYLNGINKNFKNIDDDDTNEVKKILNFMSYNIKLKDTLTREIDIIENQSKNIIQDLLESYRQKLNENDRNNWLTQYSLQYAIRNIFFNVIGNNNFPKIYDKIKNEVLSGNKIVILSHSQGNLYANEVCNQLKNDESLPEYFKIQNPFHNIQIATPASYIACGKSYFSLPFDKVVFLTNLGGALPQLEKALIPNIVHSSNFKQNDDRNLVNDLLDHGMLDSYLNDENISNKIFKTLNQEINNEYEFHGHNLPIADFEVSKSCNLQTHNLNSQNTYTLLCKNAKEGLSNIKMSDCGKYYLWGYFNENNFKEMIKIYETKSQFIPQLEQTYDKDKGFIASLKIPDEAGTKDSAWSNIKSLAGFILSFFVIGGIGGVISHKKREEDNSEEK